MPGDEGIPLVFDLTANCQNAGPIISIEVSSYDSGDGIDDPGGEDCGCVYIYDLTIDGTGGTTYPNLCDYSLINIPMDATTLTIVQRDLDEFPDSDIPIFLEVTYALDIPFLVEEPCDCSSGLDLDGDGMNEYALQVITISGGLPDYAPTEVTNLYDNTGTLLTPAAARPLIMGPDASGNYTMTAYVLADGTETYDFTVIDINGFTGSITGGPCGPCCGANNGTTTLMFGGN